jgi:N-acetylneuraminic acid mutarotase
LLEVRAMRMQTRNSMLVCCVHLSAILVIVGSTNGQACIAQTLNAITLAPLPITVANNAVTSVQHDDGSYSLYSFMGTTNPSTLATTSMAHRYDSTTGSWTRIANAPRLFGRPKVGASAISVAGEVYLIGGYTLGPTERTEERLFRYDAATDDYTQLASVPTAVDDTVVGVYEDRFLFLVSGWHGPVNNNVLNVQVYDTLTDSWEQATPLPGPNTGVFGHSGTVIGNRIISTDGTVVNNGFRITDKLYVGEIEMGTGLQPTDVTWTELSPHPGLPTYRAAASQGDWGDGRMLLLGGTDNPYNVSGQGYNGQPSFPLDQALLFDPVNGDWQSLSITGDYVPTMDHRGLVLAGDGWVTIGGMTAPGVATDRVVLYSVPEPSALLWVLAVLWGFTWRRKS